MPRWFTAVAVLCAAAAAAPVGAQLTQQTVPEPSAQRTGQIAPGSILVFTGTADATDIGLDGVALAFDPHVRLASSANTGTFATLNKPNGAVGTIADLRVGHGPQRVDRLLTVGGYTFALTFVPSGPFGQDDCYVEPVVGQRCTPFQSVQGDPTQNVGLSPFYVVNLPSGNPDAPFTSVAAFNVVGTVTGPGRVTSEFFGTIASTFVGQSYQEVLLTLEAVGLQDMAITGTFIAGRPVGPSVAEVTPEPESYALVATGLGVLGVAGWRRRRDPGMTKGA